MKRLVAALVAVALLGLGVAACGGDDDTDTTAGNDTNGDTSDTTDSGSTGNDDLDALLEKQNASSIKITYEDDSGDTFTIVNDGSSDPTRTAFMDGDTLLISTEGDANMVSCTGIDGDSPSCVETSLGGNFLSIATASMFGGLGSFLFAADEDVPFLDIDKESGEVAGREATCVTWDLSQLGAALTDSDAVSFHGCYDDETGWPLSVETTDGDGNTTFSIEATEVGEPSDSDFEPPVTPETIPGLDGMTVPSISAP